MIMMRDSYKGTSSHQPGWMLWSFDTMDLDHLSHSMWLACRLPCKKVTVQYMDLQRSAQSA
jgi:hypothetical protein